jgi:hypothetical protein
MTPAEQRILAFVVLRQAMAVTPDRLLEAVRNGFPALAPQVAVVKAGAAEGAGFIVRVGAVAVTVISVPQPIPPGTLDQAIALTRTWPEAARSLNPHRAHIIVGSLQPATDHAGAVAQARAVSAITSAICAFTPAIGVYWSPGEVVTEAAVFRDEIGSKEFPIEAWVSFFWLDGPRTARGERTLAVFTTGLLPFVGREIEFRPAPLPPAVIAERVLGTIHLLLANGPILNDGDTVGISATERIRVRHADRGQRQGVPILSLSVEQLGRAPER